MEEISFIKMHGIGNDYIYFDCLSHPLENPESAARVLSDRHKGIGGDGIVLIQSSKESDFKMRMFNADGSEAEMCGNAVRCVAKYVCDEGHFTGDTISLETGAGTVVLYVERDHIGKVDQVKVNMGSPIIVASEVPCRFDMERVISQPIEVLDRVFNGTAVSMGNPHFVIFTEEELSDNLVHVYGSALEVHPLFPKKINVEFVNISSRSEVQMRVWERGSGETMACGTGACAVVVAGVLEGRLDNRVSVTLKGGALEIEFNKDIVWMTGPAEESFRGTTAIRW